MAKALKHYAQNHDKHFLYSESYGILNTTDIMGRTCLFFLSFFFLGGCAHVYYQFDTQEITPPSSPMSMTTTLKVHLHNGSIILFPEGATVSLDSISGNGEKYELLKHGAATIPAPVRTVSIDSVASIVQFSDPVDVKSSASVSLLVIGGSIFGALLAGVAIIVLIALN